MWTRSGVEKEERRREKLGGRGYLYPPNDYNANIEPARSKRVLTEKGRLRCGSVLIDRPWGRELEEYSIYTTGHLEHVAHRCLLNLLCQSSSLGA
ncbi:hypothetical protein ACN38_g797 [Penicillium nordicum]|uniref:Uncharacterized protein n=1 Tax=Penicillium nordicum TaxID=229535 RepID=A0A0M8PCR0_9EURO|nr:hypothetical protein ACN38_g797 [Penicillium nordicum]